MEKIKRLILENKAWAHGHSELDPEFFANMAKDQNPDILWIGCSDSRVPPDEIINTKPGSLFVYRNVANVVNATDESLMSVVEYAVLYLKIKYIIICGHYNCGGVRAAFDGIDNPRLAKWTQGISEIKKKQDSKTVDELVEQNVCAQAGKVAELPVIKDARKSGQYPLIVSWVYDLRNGLIKELGVF